MIDKLPEAWVPIVEKVVHRIRMVPFTSDVPLVEAILLTAINAALEAGVAKMYAEPKIENGVLSADETKLSISLNMGDTDNG